MTDAEKTARIFKAFGDASRVRILMLLKEGERCACELLEDLNIVQSTLSCHMKILCDAGIVNARKDSKWVYYTINEEGVKHAHSLLDGITSRINSMPGKCNCHPGCC